jgi:hypothetical protein
MPDDEGTCMLRRGMAVPPQSVERVLWRALAAGDRAAAHIEDNLVRENPWLQLQRSDTSCLTVNLQTYREARQKVRYSLIATNFRFAAK